jgi:hypothetical protein
MFQPDGQTDHVFGNTGSNEIVAGKLLMGGGSRMDNQGLGIGHVGQMCKQAQAVNEFPGSFNAAFDPKGKNRAGTFFKVLFGKILVGVIRQ